MRNTRICFATAEYPPHIGGAARSAQRLVRGLARAGFDVTVFTAPWGDQKTTVLPETDEGIPLRWVSSDLDVARCTIDQEDQVHAFDLFHGFTLQAAFPCLEPAARGARPVVASIRGADGKAFDQWAEKVLRGASWVTSVSSDSLDRAAAAVCDLSGRSSVIPNGVDLDASVAWTPADTNAGVVGTVASFRPKKNIPLLIRAYARLPREIRRRLLLVGDAVDDNKLCPALRQEIEALLDTTGMRAETEITGLVAHDTLGAYHSAMRVFALSSDHEGMPNALLEAAAAGLPIVTTAVDGVKDIFTPGVDALFTPPGDEEAFAEALSRVLIDRDLAIALSIAARATASRLSLAAELDRYASLYRSLIAGQVPAGSEVRRQA